jgi:hypothetical protein
MRSVIALAALCLLYTGSLHAGVVLDTGIASFQLDQPVPGLLEKLGPLLDAAGAEELRVAAVIERPGEAGLLERWQSPRTIKLVQFIRGREVRDGFVTISFDAFTHEVTLLGANFLPDRGLNDKPRLTAAQAKAQAVRQVGDPLATLAFDEKSARLAYDSAPSADFGSLGGQLVWVFLAKDPRSDEPYEISVSSATGRIIRSRGKWLGCFGVPPGEWIDVSLSRVNEPF